VGGVGFDRHDELSFVASASASHVVPRDESILSFVVAAPEIEHLLHGTHACLDVKLAVAAA
jgi:hypothetical protein